MKKIVFLFSFIFLFSSLSFADPFIIWEQADIQNVSGFKLFYAKDSNLILTENSVVDVVDKTYIDLGALSLDTGTTYYFAAKAYNDLGESALSEIISFRTRGKPEVPYGFKTFRLLIDVQ